MSISRLDKHTRLSELEVRRLAEMHELRKAKKNQYLAGYVGLSATLGGLSDGPGGAVGDAFGALVNSWVWSKYYNKGYHLGNEQFFQPELDGGSPVLKLTGGIAATGLALGTGVGIALAATSATSLSTGAIIGISAAIGLVGLPLILLGVIIGSKYAYNKGQTHGQEDMGKIMDERKIRADEYRLAEQDRLLKAHGIDGPAPYEPAYQSWQDRAYQPSTTQSSPQLAG